MAKIITPNYKSSRHSRADMLREQRGETPWQERLYDQFIEGFVEDVDRIIGKPLATLTPQEWKSLLEKDLNQLRDYYRGSPEEANLIVQDMNHLNILDFCSMTVQIPEFVEINGKLHDRMKEVNAASDFAMGEDWAHILAQKVYNEDEGLKVLEQKRVDWLIANRVEITTHLDEVRAYIKKQVAKLEAEDDLTI